MTRPPRRPVVRPGGAAAGRLRRRPGGAHRPAAGPAAPTPPSPLGCGPPAAAPALRRGGRRPRGEGEGRVRRLGGAGAALAAVPEAADLPEARYNLGVALERQGRLAEARAEYQRGLAGRPLPGGGQPRRAAREGGGRPRRAGRLRAAARDFPEDAVSRGPAGRPLPPVRAARRGLAPGPRGAAPRPGHRGGLPDDDPRGHGPNDLDLARLVALRARRWRPTTPSGLAVRPGAARRATGGRPVQWKRALELQPGFLPARTGLLEAAVKPRALGRGVRAGAAPAGRRSGQRAGAAVLGVALRHQGKADEAAGAYVAAERLAPGKLRRSTWRAASC